MPANSTTYKTVSSFEDPALEVEVLVSLKKYAAVLADKIRNRLKHISDIEREDAIALANLPNALYTKHHLLSKVKPANYRFTRYDDKNHTAVVQSASALLTQLNRIDAFYERLNTPLLLIEPQEIIESLRPILRPTFFAEDKNTRDFSKTLLKSTAALAPEFIREQFLLELECYKDQRNVEAQDDLIRHKKLENSFKTFFGKLVGFSAQVKIDAADKMIRLLSGDPTVKLTTQDIAALRDSRLGKIISKYESLGAMPKAFYNKERSIVDRIEQRVFSRF